MLFQNDIPIDVTCHRYTLNMQVSSGTKNNSSPNEPSCTTVTVPFNAVLLSNGFLDQRCRSFAVTKNSETLASSSSGIQKILELIFFATAIEKNVQQTVAAAMTIVTTCNFTFRSHPPLSRKPRLSIYTGDVLVTSSTIMLRTLKNGTAALANHSFSGNGYLALSILKSGDNQTAN
ncbi:uncharacterized protein TNCV_4484151 [Trichonephila clavipes]|nr:uncharacterized protein TNCV_4484151 [Trichonephila clavipes]